MSAEVPKEAKGINSRMLVSEVGLLRRKKMSPKEEEGKAIKPTPPITPATKK